MQFLPPVVVHKSLVIVNRRPAILLIQTRRDDVEYVGKLLQQEMSQRLVSTKGEAFQMKCELSVGINWADMDDLKLS